MVLKPLEFSESLSDSPWFRQNLADHETALEGAYKSIKHIESQCKDLINAARSKLLFLQSPDICFSIWFAFYWKTVTKELTSGRSLERCWL